MTRSLAAAVSLVLALMSTPAGAQLRIEVPPVTVHRLMSKHVADSFEIRVLLPPMIPGEATRFPVIYMTDVYGSFLEEDMLRLMMLGDTPRFIAVGIGYPGAGSLLQALGMRARDLTHVPVPGAETGHSMPIAGMLTPAVATGGGPRFLDFIRDELMPFIDARYPTDPADRGYWGDSLGGLFGCYVLFTRPDTFQRYILGSPSIWWADADVLKLAERYTAAHEDLAAKVFLGVGALEELGGGDARMVTNVFRLERLLRARGYPSLQLTTRIFPDETHTTVPGMNLVRGLVSVFGPQKPEDGLMARYAEMAARQR